MQPIPINQHLLVELIEKKSKVYVPEDVEDSIQIGKVLALSAAIEDIKTGDIVRWQKFAEKEGTFEHKGKQIAFVPAKAVMGIIERKKDAAKNS